MIKYMTAHTNTTTGRTFYHVFYEGGKRHTMRTLKDQDDWPISIVKFFTADDTVRVEDRIVGDGKHATRYERFEKA